MSNIRVLIQDAPKILRDILEQVISGEVDMEVIPEPVVLSRAAVEPRPTPDVVVVGTNDSEPGEEARALLARWPHSHVLIITARGHRVLMYELLPRRTELGEISPTQLVQVIRSAARPEPPYTH